MNWRWIFWPFSLLYGSVTAVRNLAFRTKLLKSEDFETPVISVGNLSVGGTGKTPMIEFLIENFSAHKTGLVSRGYGRKTRGLLIAEPNDPPEQIGDEPWQIYHKFPHIHVAVAEKRTEGISELIERYEPEVIFLDDAFQHRYVSPQVHILLTTFQNPFYRDLILPAGNLREHSIGKKRADIIVVTKCPDNLGMGDADAIRQKMRPKWHQKVFFAGIEYGNFINRKVAPPTTRNIHALTGIAGPALFLERVKKYFNLTEHHEFPDHHNFTGREIEKIAEKLKDHPILTTEKDYARLGPLLPAGLLDKLYYLPIKVKFLWDTEQEFLNAVKEKAGLQQ